ncbi:MAG: tRNA epoxyqueuosine(34) reductase QueG [Chloroflexota bacterium]
MLSGLALRRRIEAQARDLGFTLFGVTSAEPPGHLEVYRDWLQAGRQAEMGYLASERAWARRAEPRLILPECRSILTLGAPYWNPQDVPPDGESGLRGRVAAYAWGQDYHDIFVKRLRTLAAFIESQVGLAVPMRWYSDTGPLLERELAQRAGLGWIGKNTCLIDPRRGSYFLLAELLTGLDLEPDAPFTDDRCGKCRRCLEACPTGCILPDRTIDSRRCISYLTIELKGPIPLDLRPGLGEWVFGCDVCQQVCPWNQRFGQAQGDQAFAAQAEVARPRLADDLTLTPEGFSAKFKGSPVKRARRRGYLRNVAVALGNRLAGQGDEAEPDGVKALVQALRQEAEPLVRGHAAWALGRVGGKAAHQGLINAMSLEIDEYVLKEIDAALTDPGAVEK